MGNRNRVVPIPPRLLCVSIEGPNINYSVPFPIGANLVSVYIGGDEDSEQEVHEEAAFYRKYVINSPYFIITHPESPVGVLGTYINQYVEGSLLFLKLSLISRVFIIDDGLDENKRLYAGWSVPDEFVPTEDVFKSKVFQEKIDRLRELHAKFLITVYQIEGNNSGTGNEYVIEVDLMPNSHTPETIGPFIDYIVNQLNDFVDESDVVKKLVKILVEKDVEKRLDKAISLYNYSLQNVEKWLRPTPKKYSRSDLIRTILMGGSAPKTSPDAGKSSGWDRAELIKNILIRPAITKPDTGGEE
ncbi:MAG: hypothetical protein AAB617_02030 [Patescibacteria group bacterium]